MAKTRNLGNLSDFLTATGTNVTTTTAAQFDNSTGLATTAFVQRAIGNMQSITTYAVSTTIPASVVGSWVAPTANSLTLTLPLASSVPGGSILSFYGNSNTGTIIARQGTDTIVMGSSNVTSLSLLGNDRLTLISISAAGWYAVGGEAAMGYSSSFGFSATAGGYQKLPTGIIVQWGSLPSIGASSTGVLNYPIAFTAGLFAVVGLAGASAGGAQGSIAGFNAAGSGNSLTGFSYSNLSGSAATQAGTYMAVGK